MLRSTTILGSTLAVFAACASGSQDTAETPPAPTLELVSPVTGDRVCGEPLALTVAVENYTLIGFDQPESSVPGVGHIDIKLNGQNRWMTDDTEIEIPLVDDGVYLIEALLVDGEHHAISPPTSDEAEVTVDASACTADSSL